MLQPAATPSTDARAEAVRIASELRGGEWLHLLQEWGLKLLAAALIFLVGRWLARRLSTGLDRVMGRAGVDAMLGGFLRNTAYAVMLVLVIMTALTAIGIPTTSMFAVLGAAGLAVGLALKDSLSNIASGVMLIVLRPFRAGDHVVVAGQEGTALEIRVFQTRVRAADHRIIILPNSSITTAPIINHSALPQRRIEVRVGVGYGDDLQLARATLLGIAVAWALTLALLDVDFTANGWMLAIVNICAIATVAALGATTILAAFRTAPARLLREL